MLWTLALQALRRRPLRTTLTALGVAVAVGSTVIFLSLGEGLRQVFTSELGSFGPELQVSYGPFDATTSLTSLPELNLDYLERLRAEADGYGIASITPMLFHLRSGLTPGSAMVFQGLPAEVEPSTVYTGFEVVAGRGLSPADAGAMVAVVGSQAAERFGVGVGSELRLNPASSFEVVGIAASEGGLIDNGVLVPLRSLQSAIGIHDRVTFLALDLRDPARAARVAEELAESYPELGFQTRGDILAVVERGIRISDFVRLGISVIALVVGAIAVANTMLMSVFERTREFGVIRAVGARPRFLFALVLAESVLVSLVGAAAGLGIGRGGIAAVNSYSLKLVGLEVAVLTPRLAAFAVAVAVVVGLMAGLMPAARAARIPVATAMARE